MRAPGKCPTCGQELEIRRLYCPDCQVSIEGKFTPCQFCRLNQEQQHFVLTFLQARGNIKEVEGLLGISYPTVRNRLTDIMKTLGLESALQAEEEAKQQRENKRKQILQQLEQGEISAVEAAEMLRMIKNKGGLK